VLSNNAGKGDAIIFVITATELGDYDTISSVPEQMELEKQYCLEVIILTRDMEGNVVIPRTVDMYSTIGFDEFTPVTECKKAGVNSDVEPLLLTNALDDESELELLPMSEVPETLALPQAETGQYSPQYFVTTLHQKTGFRDLLASVSSTNTRLIKTVEGISRPIVKNYAKTVTKGTKLNETLTITTARPDLITYTCKNLPAGVTVANGKVTGTPTKAGKYTATCTPKNTVGVGNQFTVTLTVTDPVTIKSTSASSVAAKNSRIPIPAQLDLIFRVLDIKGNVHTEGIGYSYKHGITKGCSWSQKAKLVTTKYCPSNAVNRGSMAELMWNLMGQPKITKTVPTIKDISKLSKNRQTAVKWLASEGITIIDDEHRFNPANPVNRGAMAEFLYKLTGSPKYTPTSAELKKFKDIGTLTAPRKKAIAWLAKTGITTGVTKTTYVPGRAVNRGSMATFFMRLIQKFGGK
jgi:hypothetical protein